MTPSPAGTTLQVIAFKPGMNDSGVNSGTYYYESDSGAGANDSAVNSANMPNPGDGGPGGGVIPQDGQTISYDANGNLISYKGWVYRYDAQNRLIYASNGTTSATFYYDGKNRQIARNINGVIRFNSWDGWELLEEYSSSLNVATAYLQGSTGVIKSWSAANTLYYYQDKLGSTTHVANVSGQLVENYHYDLTGKPSYFSSTSQPLNSSTVGVSDLYAGERWIPELALYDLRNRFMSPELGRFLQADPIGFQGDASNLYRYCGNDPVDRTDPTGLADTSAASEIWRRQAAFDTASSSHSGLEQLDKRQEQVAAARAQDMASHAENSVGSTKYHNTRWGTATHCNEFPADMAEASGRARPQVWQEEFLGGRWRTPVSHEYADPSVNIPHWSAPRPLSEARRNDIIAQAHGKSGHSGVVVGPRDTITVNTGRDGGVVERKDWGFRPKLQNGEGPRDPAPVVRHYLGGAGSEW